MTDVRINRNLTIPEGELELSFARAGGPGGQHVNTAATKVELRFDVERSRALSAEEKERILRRLGPRLTKDGVLVLQASEHRSQAMNRRAVVGRFRNLVREAIRQPKQRKPTRPSRAARERRIEAKRRRSEKKRLRKPPEIPPS